MHPALSVIVFTTASGAGYGILMLLGVLALGRVGEPWQLAVMAVPGFILVTVGLVSSTLHLGHPERSWRAFSQWRSSWLSREGVAAVASYIPAVIAIALALIGRADGGGWTAALIATAVLAIITVACTGMIYASLKPIPRWNNGWVVPVYLAFAIATGAAWLAPIMAFTGPDNFRTAVWIALVASLFAWAIKLGYWRSIDHAAPKATTARAIGLEHMGTVRLLEGPHTGANYVMREMGYQLARKHAKKLRTVAGAAGGAITPLLLLIAALTGHLATGVAIATLAALLASLAVLIERWLFFAEAEHMSMLYYGGGAAQ